MTPELKNYKLTCLKVGFFMASAFLLREIATFIVSMVEGDVFELRLILSFLFLQVVPAIICVFMFNFKGKTLKDAYHIPERNLRALANYPAIYGLGMTVNLITILVMTLITSVNAAEQNPVLEIVPEDFTMEKAVFMFVQVVILAPIFEEFIYRGALLNALKPYGNGVAVFTTALLFGLTHGNFQQFFYAFAVGIPLAYIAIATNSVFSSTCLHAMVNSVTGIILLFFTNDTIDKVTKGGYTPTDDEKPIVLLFTIFVIFVIATAVIGLVLMICKLVKIKKYRLPLVWDEISNGKKAIYLLITPGAIISVALVVDVFGGFYSVSRLLLKLVGA